MKHFFLYFAGVLITAVGLPAVAMATDTFEGFTEPIESLQLAAVESGRVESVTVQLGQQVKQGDLLVALDTAVLKAAKQVAQAKASASARTDALRVECQLLTTRHEKLVALVNNGAGSVEEVQRAKADAEVAKLNIEAAEEDLLRSGLELAEIETRIEQRLIRSPIDGLVTEVETKTGEFVSLNQPHVVTIVQLHQLRVTFYLPTEVAEQLEIGTGIPMQVEHQATAITGVVEYIAAVTHADSGRVRVDILVDNPQRRIRSGLRCRLSLGVAP